MKGLVFTIIFFTIALSAFAQRQTDKEVNTKIVGLSIAPSTMVRSTPIKFYCGHRKSIETSPLWVVDGQQVKVADVESINPKDIESVTVVKGSKAIDIYGKAAEHGAIILTTKCKKPTTNEAL